MWEGGGASAYVESASVVDSDPDTDDARCADPGEAAAGCGVVCERWDSGRAVAGAFDEDEGEDICAAEDAGGGAEETWRGCFVDHRAHPPDSPPRTAPIHGIPTPSRPLPFVGPAGAVVERDQTTSNGSLMPR